MTMTSEATDEVPSGCGADGRVKAEPRPTSEGNPGAEPRPQFGGDRGAEPRPSFEESTRRLAKIVAELEGGDLPLERALALFEEGVQLSRSAQERLDRAEKRVEELLGMDAEGRPVTREFEG
jgi:exodeoxyribonuclease VII small subunit